MTKEKTIRIKLGDIFKVPLNTNSHGYGQYYMKHRLGPVVRIFNIITKKEIELDEIVLHDLMFPPVIVGLNAAIREKVWEKIGNKEIDNLVIPKFKSSFNETEDNSKVWFLIDGEKETKLGKKLPLKYKDLESAVGWSAYDIKERILRKGKLPKGMEWVNEM
jgi:hypothetical protein